MAVNSAKLYHQVAASIAASIAGGRYPVGGRLPSERDLAEDFGVSRPTIREAMLALEIRGMIEARHGSGIYVVDAAAPEDAAPQLQVTPVELIEARALIEGEAAALAATVITDAELQNLEAIVREMQRENEGDRINEEADRRFHMAIADATGNAALASVVENLWNLRYSQPCHEVLSRARRSGVAPRVDEHEAIVDALRRHDPQAARKAMRGHLERVIDYLLASTESEAVERARLEVAVKRAELTRRRAI